VVSAGPFMEETSCESQLDAIRELLRPLGFRDLRVEAHKVSSAGYLSPRAVLFSGDWRASFAAILELADGDSRWPAFRRIVWSACCRPRWR
jgi:hypothetical protein